MTATEERDALLRGVLAEPDRDAPRLVYADHLEEYGDDNDRDRAEFIRVQVELESLRDCDLCRRTAGSEPWRCVPCVRLKRRSTSLLADRGLSWLPPSAELASTSCHASWTPVGIRRRRYRPEEDDLYVFRRGFVEEIRAPLQVLLDHGPAILRAHPVQRMVVTDCRPAYHDLYADRDPWTWGGDDLHEIQSVFPAFARKWFATEEGALEALYAAVLAHCKEPERNR